MQTAKPCVVRTASAGLDFPETAVVRGMGKKASNSQAAVWKCHKQDSVSQWNVMANMSVRAIYKC